MSEDPSVDRGDEFFRGRGAKVAVLDFSFWRGHEDIERIEMEVKQGGRVVPRWMPMAKLFQRSLGAVTPRIDIPAT